MSKKKELKKSEIHIAEKILAEIETLVDKNAIGNSSHILDLAKSYNNIKSYWT